MSQTTRAAVVLSNDDINGGAELFLHNCEDCAPAVSSQSRVAGIPAISPAAVLADDRTWTCAPEVVEIRIDPEHILLFNPVGDGSPVVVNELAYRIFRRFTEPATVRDIMTSRPADGADDVTGDFPPTAPSIAGAADRTPRAAYIR